MENTMAIEVDKKLKSLGVSTIKYYYKNCPLVGNIFTACVLMSEDQKILARGVAICSVSESHNKDFSRKLTLKRAKRAFFSQQNNEEITGNSFLMDGEILKYFKVKNKETKKKLIENIQELDFPYYERSFDGVERLDVMIPYAYPLEMTKDYFKYKSEYQPQPTEEEKKMFKLV